MNDTPFPVPDWQQRTAILLKPEGVARLAAARVLLVGVGGVGGHAAEALVRAGVGHLTLIDFDRVQPSNCNRQLAALHSTVGESKVAVLRQRLLDINPALELQCRETMVTPDNVRELLLAAPCDFLLDAIDTLSAKCALLATAFELGIPTVSAMGAGGKLDPAQVRLADIAKTTNCRLARQVRSRLRRLGVSRGILTVFSTELAPDEAIQPPDPERGECRSTVGTISYMPALFGLYMASAAIRRLTKNID